MKLSPLRLLAFSSLLLAACAAGPGDNGTPDGGTDDKKPKPTDGPALLGKLDCDPLVPTQCAFPFPSNVYLIDDATTATGKRVRFGKGTLPRVFRAAYMDPAQWADSDGFSPSAALLAHFPGATVEGLPSVDDIGLSLTATSPTVVVEAETGEWVPHWTELDMTSTADDDRAFMIRPAVRLKDATRYLVAIRGVKDASGSALEAGAVFKALRDGTESDNVSVAPRRELYADIFAKLAGAGVARENLQLAWDFTTASRQNNTRDILHMRDEALAWAGSAGPSYRIEKVTTFEPGDRVNEGVSPPTHHSIWRRIEGKFTAPLYLTKTEPGARLVRGADGLPTHGGNTAEFDFLVQIPFSAQSQPCAILQQLHGLLGSRNEARNGFFARLANQKCFVTVATNLIGMAVDDEDYILQMVTGDMGRYRESVDRQHQGMLNALLAMRLLMGDFAGDPQTQYEGRPTIKTGERYYRGDSQGGIMGATYMALSQDVQRGYLGEPGSPYNLLLNRSVDFDQFFDVLTGTYSSYVDLAMVLALVQMHWDRMEPSGYLPYITSDTLPNTPPKEVLIHVAIGDYQVTPLGAHIMARAVGAKSIGEAVRPIWGIEEVPRANQPFTGSAIQEFDFGLPEVPKTNVPPRDKTKWPANADPHDEVREMPEVFEATDRFFRTGEHLNFCDGVPRVAERRCSAP